MVTIEIFKLDDPSERPMFYGGRARALSDFFTNTRAIEHDPDPVVRDAAQTNVERMLRDSEPFASCLRAFHRLCQNDPNAARDEFAAISTFLGYEVIVLPPIPTNPEILTELTRLDTQTADDLETQWLEFKPWSSPKDDMRIAVEYAVCFANAEGGVIVFGVADRTRGRVAAIHGAGRCDLDIWQPTSSTPHAPTLWSRSRN